MNKLKYSAQFVILCLTIIFSLNCLLVIGFFSKIEAGECVERTYFKGITPLMVSSKEGDLEVSKRLLEEGASVDAKSNTDTTALMFAAINGNLDICKLLVEFGANVNAKDIHGTSLIYATIAGHMNVVSFLLENGADMLVEDSKGINSLEIARKSNNESMLSLFMVHSKTSVIKVTEKELLAFKNTLRHRYHKEEDIYGVGEYGTHIFVFNYLWYHVKVLLWNSKETMTYYAKTNVPMDFSAEKKSFSINNLKSLIKNHPEFKWTNTPWTENNKSEEWSSGESKAKIMSNNELLVGTQAFFDDFPDIIYCIGILSGEIDFKVLKDDPLNEAFRKLFEGSDTK